jgi:hypothetical protein
MAEMLTKVVIVEDHTQGFRVRLNLRDPADCRTIHVFGSERWANDAASRINHEIVTLVRANELPLADPRPDDMAELARLVAIELRKTTWATWVGDATIVLARLIKIDGHIDSVMGSYSLYGSDFSGLGPIACAASIRDRESALAQEWAGDK